MSNKPHKGQIKVGGFIRTPGGFAYRVKFWYNHPQFGTRPAGVGAHTSLIVEDHHGPSGRKDYSYEIETLNSRYTVVPDNYEPPK